MTWQLLRTAGLPRVERGMGIRSLPLAGPANCEQLLIGMTEIPAGIAIPLHTHSSEEFILVLTGTGLVRVKQGDSEVIESSVSAMDATLISPGIPHQFVNIGGNTMRIMWIYGDPDTTRTLMESGQVQGHLDTYS